MITREDLTPEDINKLEAKSKAWGGKSIELYTKEELLNEAEDNHIWLSAFACINPTKEYAQELGMSILHRLSQTEMRDSMGISHMMIFTINKS